MPNPLPQAPHRVLHVIPSIGPARGGPSTVIRTMARGQADCGLEVHVAATDDDGPERRTPPPNLPFSEGNVTYWIFPRQTRFYLFSLPLTLWLWKHIRDYDVVHIHALFSYSSVAAASLAAWTGVPYIVRPLGTLSRWGRRNRRPWLKNWSYRCIESHILKSAAAVQYTSEQEALEANELRVPDNGVVIPNPVDAPAETSLSAPARQGQTVLFLSRIHPQKGLDLLLSAFARVRIDLPETVLLIAGDGPPRFVDSLKRQSRELGLEPAVIWEGFLQGEAKRAALARAEVFVLPSYSDSFGVAAVEAMAAGLPVIVSNQVGIHREISNASAGLVSECSVDSLAAALVRLLGDAALRARMGNSALALARHFSREAVALRLVEVYAAIRSGNGQPIVA